MGLDGREERGEVGGNSVRFPFIVTEVYVKESGKWQLSTLAFTKTLGE